MACVLLSCARYRPLFNRVGCKYYLAASTAKFDSRLKAAGVDPAKLPPRSPNLNAHAERFVRSVKQECLKRLILSSEQQLRYVLSECLEYCHHERIHQGLNRIIEPQHQGRQGDIICIERLGGLLKSIIGTVMGITLKGVVRHQIRAIRRCWRD